MIEEDLKEQMHQNKMINDVEYFCEYTIENLYIIPQKTQGIFLFDIIDEMRKECNKYNQEFKDLLDYIGGIWWTTYKS